LAEGGLVVTKLANRLALGLDYYVVVG